MNTNLSPKMVLWIFALMLVCSLALALNIKMGYHPENNPSPEPFAALDGGVSLAEARLFPVAESPRYVATADFNEDGYLDLVVTHAAGVTVMIGDGEGNFSAGGTFSAGPSPSQIAVADFNGDKHMDLAVSNSDQVAILLGNGQGQFEVPRFYLQPGLQSIAVAAFNRDGAVDIILASTTARPGRDGRPPLTGSIRLLVGDGKGGFSPRRISTIAAEVLATGDFNNDQIMNFVHSQRSYGYCVPSGRTCVSRTIAADTRLWRGDGQGGFTPGFDRSDPYPTRFLGIAAADVNQDGNLDLVVMHATSGVGVLLGDGRGNFGAPRYFAVAAGFLTVGDFNMDNIPDVAITQSGERIVVMMGDGRGNFTAPTAFDTGRSPVALAIGDFDGDEIPDIVTADTTSGTVSVLLNTTFQ
jgi:hypothetical protein